MYEIWWFLHLWFIFPIIMGKRKQTRKSTREPSIRGREWLSVNEEVAVGLWFFYVTFRQKIYRFINQGVRVRTFSTRLYGKLWEPVTTTDFFNNEIGVQWHRNSELIVALISATQCSSMITMSILDDNVFRMCPSDVIAWDNRGTKGVRLGQKVLEEPVSY